MSASSPAEPQAGQAGGLSPRSRIVSVSKQFLVVPGAPFFQGSPYALEEGLRGRDGGGGQSCGLSKEV
jgi:hypothetical protein